jgi:glycosyltransferase involved in cell wall biosynthesis
MPASDFVPTAFPPVTLGVVIISRNEALHIARCIESVLAATHAMGTSDTVLVDSCSRDQTVQIARRYPIRVIELAPGVVCCPALGRHVGIRLTRGEFVLCVDGDTEIDTEWVQRALAVLVARPTLGGVAGREDQLYYVDGIQVGGKRDYFGNGDSETTVDEFGGNAIYRRAALDAVGSFNPYIRSFEEAELGARLRRMGWQLVRIPVAMATHHTQKPDTASEYWRRLRGHLFTGHGQVLRIALRQGLFWEHARKLNRTLLFLLWSTIGLSAAAGSLLIDSRSPVALWGAISGVLIATFMVRSRSTTKPFRLIFDWAMCSIPLLWGFLLSPADPRRFQLEAVLAPDVRELSAPLPARELDAAWDS